MSLRSQLVRHPGARRRAVGAALGLLCSSACGGDASDPEAPEAGELTTLNCNEPFPEPLFTQITGGTEAAPPVPDAAALASMGVVEQMAQAGQSLLAINPQERPYKVFVPEQCVPLGEVYSTGLRICVDVAGNVSGVAILVASLPISDSQLPYVISRWRYEPYVVEGTPTPFCYNLTYTVR